MYACDNFAAGSWKVDWLWSIAREPQAIGSASHTALTETVFGIINSKLENPIELRPTQQTMAEGCTYSTKPEWYEGRDNNRDKYERQEEQFSDFEAD